MSQRETSRNYANPYRPFTVRAANMWKGFREKSDPTKLNPEHLIYWPIQWEESEDFGDPEPTEPLAHLWWAMETEANLHPLGRLIQQQRIYGLMRNRLRAQTIFKNHPDVLTRPIKAPVVITGLQRTGTTLLHRLLAADPRMRSLRSWEAMAPAPLTPPWVGKRDPRKKDALRAQKALKHMAPDFFAVHPIDAVGVEEDVLLLDTSVYSTVPEATMRVPSFSEWLETRDQRPAYDTLKKMLQLLDWQESRERWLLKTPHHLEWLDVLFDVFPDAKIIHTHRDPVTTLGSFCSMVAHGYGICSDDVRPHEIGAHWLAKTGRMVDRALHTRKARNGEGFHDVFYGDLMNDPIGEIEKIYGFLGMNFDDRTKALIGAARAKHPQHKHGKHVYDLSDFGLTETNVADRFAGYCEQFQLGS